MEKPSVVYPVRLTPSVFRRLQARAEDEGRPVANYIRRVLDLATRGAETRAPGNGGQVRPRRQ